jgi:hypothetical protein
MLKYLSEILYCAHDGLDRSRLIYNAFLVTVCTTCSESPPNSLPSKQRRVHEASSEQIGHSREEQRIDTSDLF